MNESLSIEKISEANRLLAECQTIEETNHIASLAAAARHYAMMQKLGLEAVNLASELKIRTDRRRGQILIDMRQNGELAKPGDNQHSLGGVTSATASKQTLADLDISKHKAVEWTTIAAMPEETFETVISTTKNNGDELTSAGMLRVAKSQGMQVHYSSENDKWNTPPKIITRTLLVLGEIDLDPCSNDKQHPNVPARHYFTVEDNGLEQGWFGNVYMNPPYGDEIGAWVDKLIQEYENDNVDEAIALVPARTDTRWFRQLKPFARCFIWGRLKFSDADNSAPFPSMVVYLGTDLKRFAEAFQDIGDIYVAVG